MAFRYSEVDPVYLDDDGNPCAGGSLTYTRTGGSTAHNVYSDAGLGTSLGNVITLDASGRAPDHWLDASTHAYRRVLKNAAGVAQGETRDNIREIDTAGVEVPDPASGSDGEVPMVDGGAYVLTQVLASLLPDMTGHSGKQLGTDGALAFWEAKAAAVEYDEDNLPGGIEQTTTSVQIGNMLFQTGSGTIPSAAAQTSSLAVTFATPFASAPKHISLTATVGAVTGESGGVELSAVSPSATGFTATAIAPDMGAVGGSENITSNVTFTYLAIGLVS